MIAFGSLIGFALVFFCSTWVFSAAAGVGLRVLKGPLQKRGAGAEKRAAALALVVPPILGGLVTAALAGFSITSPNASDHCGTHDHHLHLCLIHGGEWAHRLWALASVSALSAFIAVRFARLSESLWLGRRRLQFVRRSSRRVQWGDALVFLAPSERAFCFVAGLLSPRIYVSVSLWERLSAEERDAMLAHEAMHISNRDLWASVALSVFALFGAPTLAAQYKRLWSESTERFCDRIAADNTGCNTTMATALLNLARGPRMAGTLSFLPKPESVEDRIVALLAQERTGRRLAKQIAWSAVVFVALAMMLTTALADPLHHAFETLFGLI